MAGADKKPATPPPPTPRPQADPRLVMQTVKSGKTPTETTDHPGPAERR